MANLDVLFRADQYVGPESLAELCFQVICKNLDIISVKDKHGYRNLLEGVVFPSEICDKLIEYVLRNEPNEGHDGFFTIFKNVWTTKLKRVKIVGRNITDYSVHIVTNHKLAKLELTDCPQLTEYSIESINANAENLHTLIFHGTSAIIPTKLTAYEKRGYVFATPHLRTLALECVVISASEYNILLSGLTNLTSLDLSNSFDIGSFDFFYLVPNLVSLVLYNVKITSQAQSFVNNICHLKNLRHLDISQINPQEARFINPKAILTDIVNGLPELTSLDISGTNLAVDVVNRGIQTGEHSFYSDVYNNNLCDIPGLISRVDRPLQFLGLYDAIDAPCRRRNIPAKLIAGNANEDQILIAAYVYMNNKDLMQNVIGDLYKLYRYENCHRMDQALCAVLDAMEKYPAHKGIQISGSAALFYIVKMKEKGELETRLKKRIVRTLLVGMCAHKNEETMMRNGCLTLYQFRLPHDVMSHYETLVKLLLHLVKRADHQSYIQRIAVFLLNTLACHVTGKEKRLLGQLGCIKKMLELIRYRVDSRTVCDDVMEVAWSTMWNVTDETPVNCERFFKENGMQLFFRCVKQYPNKEDLLKNMMGLLGNVAEVQNLRVHLMPYMPVFTGLIRNVRETIEVPYNAVGILAHIASDGVEAWTIEKPSRNAVLELMVEAIERWDLSSERNINYRSFLPLLRLVDVYHTPQCQHWAIWALANLTSVYPYKYCILVIREGGLVKLNNLISDPRPYERIKELAHIVIENCHHYSCIINDMNAVDEDVYNSDS